MNAHAAGSPAAGSPAAPDSLAKSTVLLMCGKTVAFALTFALPLLLVRRLSQADFGLYKQVFLLVGSAITILPLGFVMSAFYFLPRQPDKRARVAFNILLFYALVGAAAGGVLLARPTILQSLFHDPALGALARPIAIVILLMVAFSFLELIALANGEVRTATILIVVMNVTKTVLLLGAAFLFGTVEALIYAGMLQGLVQAGLLLWYLGSRFPGFALAADTRVMGAQLVYALPLGAAVILSVAQFDLHYYFVAHYFDAATYAVYAVGCFQLPFLAILNESVGSVMIPAVSQLQLQANPREILRLTARLMRALASLYFPLYAFLLVVGREVLTVLFTSQYIDSWPIFAVYLSFVPMCILTSACDPVLRAYPAYTPIVLRIRVVLLGVMVAALWLVTSNLLLVGTIAVLVGINLLDRVILAVMLGRALGVSKRDLVLFGDLGKLAVAAALAGLAAAGTRALVAGSAPLVVIMVTGVVFVCFYLLAVVRLDVPTSDELQTVRQWGELCRRWLPVAVRPGLAGASPVSLKRTDID